MATKVKRESYALQRNKNVNSVHTLPKVRSGSTQSPEKMLEALTELHILYNLRRPHEHFKS